MSTKYNFQGVLKLSLLNRSALFKIWSSWITHRRVLTLLADWGISDDFIEIVKKKYTNWFVVSQSSLFLCEINLFVIFQIFLMINNFHRLIRGAKQQVPLFLSLRNFSSESRGILSLQGKVATTRRCAESFQKGRFLLGKYYFSQSSTN